MKKDEMAFNGEAYGAMRDATRHFRNILTEKTLQYAKNENQRVATKGHVMLAICDIFGKKEAKPYER